MFEDPVLRTINSYDQVAEEYTARTRIEGDRKFCEKMLDRTSDILPPKPRIIDLGCGDGRDVAYLGRKGADVVGIDLSAEMVKLARRANPHQTFLKMDMRNTVFPDESFHGIWASASIIHIPKAQIHTLEREVYRILEPQGVFAFSFKLGEGEGFEKCGAMKEHPRYFVYHTLEDVRHLFKKFEITDHVEYPHKVLDSLFMYCWAVKR